MPIWHKSHFLTSGTYRQVMIFKRIKSIEWHRYLNTIQCHESQPDRICKEQSGSRCKARLGARGQHSSLQHINMCTNRLCLLFVCALHLLSLWHACAIIIVVPRDLLYNKQTLLSYPLVCYLILLCIAFIAKTFHLIT